jgi:hypothetical protein
MKTDSDKNSITADRLPRWEAATYVQEHLNAMVARAAGLELPTTTTPPQDEFGVMPRFAKRVRELGTIIGQIAELASGEEIDEDTLRPTDYAIAQTHSILWRACQVLLADSINRGVIFHFPKGYVSTDSCGGLRIEWTSAQKRFSVRLVVPPQEGGTEYLYHEFGAEFGSQRKVTGALLASMLKHID